MSEPVDERATDPAVADGSKQPESGVDASLVAWMLSLSAVKRLAFLQGQVDSIVALRNARIHTKVS
jgi:hypothetical protein